MAKPFPSAQMEQKADGPGYATLDDLSAICQEALAPSMPLQPTLGDATQDAPRSAANAGVKTNPVSKRTLTQGLG